MDILVVDDNTAMRETIKSVLSRTHATFHQCSSGREAVEFFERIHPDWVLMDICMEGTDGLSAAEAISRRHPDARIIIVTNYNDPEFRAEAGRLHVRGYVLKENLAELRDVIHAPITDENEQNFP